MVGLLEWIREDWSGLFNRVSGVWPPARKTTSRADPLIPFSSDQIGLHTYHLQLRDGQRRVHLRLEPSGGGVLFVDVTDVIHLNSTAAQLAKWALDGVPQRYAEQFLRQNCEPKSLRQIKEDSAAIYDMVARLANPNLGCATCSIGKVDRQPLFSTTIQAPYKADLAITYKCNNDCPHCYNEADRLTLESMSADDWKQVIHKLHQVGIPHLIFTGGEATLYPNLPELIEYANSLGPICGLNTNGRRFAHSEYAKRLAAAGLNHVQITLGSHLPEVHDRMMNAKSFDQTIRGIRNAIDAGLHTITNTTLMQMNAGQIESTIDWLYRIGIRTFAINGMIYSGGGYDTGQAIREELLPPILIRIRDQATALGMRFLWYTPTMYCRLSPVELEIGAKRCNAGEYSLCVEPNADVLPCQSYYVAAGNLLRDSWQEIWMSTLFRSFRDREEFPEQSGLPKMCWECPDLPLCGGGCRIEREAASGVRIASVGAGGCGSGGCSSGCKTGGCSVSADLVQSVPLSLSATGISGFVSLGSLEQQFSAERRRGSGNFSSPVAR